VTASAIRATAYLRVAFGVGLALAVLWAAAVIVASSANGTLGYDYRAYHLAAQRFLAGEPMYDPNAVATGTFGLFFYPPPFAMLLVPLTLLPESLAVWAWTIAMAVVAAVAVWLMPVSARVRWIVLLLAALSWPLVYAIKLGQVGPLVLLLFAIGWRWLDRPGPLGLSAGLGTIIKIQPALIVGWAVLTGRRRAAAIALITILLLSAVATLVTGPGVWLDEASLLSRVSRPVLTPLALGPGRLAYEAGASEAVATAIHYANLGLVALVALIATLRATPVASYLAIVVASHFASPVLWDHYALVLLLPTAFLLARGLWWAAAIPLATSTIGSALGVGSGWAYPAAFWVALLAVTVVGLRDARAGTATTPPAITG
jgi:alpha-1,2-mannosyltransferase